jgi:hypothetical protein
MASTQRAVLALAAAAFCSCVTKRNGFHVDVVVVAAPGALQDRVVEVEGIAAKADDLYGQGSVVATLCTTDPAAFRSQPLRVRILHEARVVSETVLRDRACRDVQHARFDGFVERVTLVLPPDSTLSAPAPSQVTVDLLDQRAVAHDGVASGQWVVRPIEVGSSRVEPSATCSGPGSPEERLLGGWRISQSKCGGRPACERRDLGPAASTPGTSVQGLKGCTQ